MGAISEPTPVLLITAAFSRHASALAWGRAKCEAAWGPVALESEVFDFVETDYYDATMGAGQKKQLWAFEQLIDPSTLVEVKRATNDWEAELAASGSYDDERPLNLDPGYLTLAKLVLASSKDHAHRIYVAQGIYAEVTLSYRKGGWQKHPWTFPDYQRADYQAFFDRCRDQLRSGRGNSSRGGPV
jgi:hypothetical protein